jgi:hypothetical protein
VCLHTILCWEEESEDDWMNIAIIEERGALSTIESSTWSWISTWLNNQYGIGKSFKQDNLLLQLVIDMNDKT